MATYFIEKSAVRAQEIIIEGELHHHLAAVLRLRSGEELTLSDGETVYRGTVAAVSGSALTVTVRDSGPPLTELPVEVTLLQALPKGDKMDSIVRQCTELGVSRIIPMQTAHCDVKLKADRAAARVARWQKIAAAAAEQSGRGRIPRVELPCTPEQALSLLAPDVKLLFFYEHERQCSYKQALAGPDAPGYALIIGPEGGFSADEAALLRQRAGGAISLGPRILRTETAGAAALAAWIYEKGAGRV